MRKISLKFAVCVIAFIVGVTASAIWFIKPFALNQNLEVAPPLNIETEMSEEYAVYSVVINDLFVKDRNSTNPLSISNQTSFYENVGYLDDTTSEQRVQNMKQYYSSVSDETLLDYETKQTKTFKVYPNFNLPVEYILVDAKEVKKSKGYAAEQMIRLSKVGFNKEKNQAFVYVEYFCGLCGQSNHLLLEKENGLWKIKEDFGGWNS
jgi:hypothetical protein